MKNFSIWNAYPNEEPEKGVMLEGLGELERLFVMEENGCYTIISHEIKTSYTCKANSAERAIGKFLDWLCGQVPILYYDEEAEGMERSDRTAWASVGYRYEQVEDYEWEHVEER